MGFSLVVQNNFLIKTEVALNNMLHSEPAIIKWQTKEETTRE